MPRLSDSMEEGTILRWLVADGATVARGEEIVEIETDKANMTYEADAAGALAIVAPEGATVAVGAPIARIGDEAAAPGGVPAAVAAPAGAAPPVSAPAGAAASDAGPAAPSAPVPVAPPAAADPAAANGRGPAARVSASPLARRAAARLGVALEALAGSGPRGRILKADVTRAAADGSAQPAAAAPTAVPESAGGKGAATVEPLSRLQQTIARRMSESKATVPDFAVAVDVDMGELLALRVQLKQLRDPAPSVNDMIVRAAALTLRAHPRVNGAYRDGAFELYEHVNVGVAVAVEDGLIVPVVPDADRRTLTEIAEISRALVARTRAGAIAPPELSGGTFTVSNLGMMGVDRFAGIVNQPQAAILCVGATRDRPAVLTDGSIAARPLATFTLVSDHRILYGADAAAFLADLRGALERPLGLLS